jgi:hypothetical protein
LYGNYLPIVILVIVTFTVIEAAGAAEEYPHLKERRSYGLIIMFCTWQVPNPISLFLPTSFCMFGKWTFCNWTFCN